MKKQQCIVTDTLLLFCQFIILGSVFETGLSAGRETYTGTFSLSYHELVRVELMYAEFPAKEHTEHCADSRLKNLERKL